MFLRPLLFFSFGSYLSLFTNSLYAFFWVHSGLIKPPATGQQALHRRAHQILQWCERTGANATLLHEAEQGMAEAVERMPNPDGYMYRNLVSF
eukprot:scaffold109202_cov18-Prasinocladus_malaysianus.AAC.1